MNAFVTGSPPVRHGKAHPNIVPYEVFETADGGLMVAVGSERQWQRFCEALGMPALATDPRFATNGDRVVNRDVLRPLIAEQLVFRTRADWQAALEAAEVPCGPILDVVEAFAAPEARSLAMEVPLEHPVLGTIQQVGFPFAFERTPPAMRSATARFARSPPSGNRAARSSGSDCDSERPQSITGALHANMCRKRGRRRRRDVRTIVNDQPRELWQRREERNARVGDRAAAVNVHGLER